MHIVTHVRCFQADSLERDALEILGLARSLKNTLAPINGIPSDVISLLPDYCDEGYADEFSINCTHVCRSWREIFVSRSSLWTNLDFKNVEKTRTYIQRSRCSPLNISLQKSSKDITYLDDAFSLVIPHIHRLKSLAIIASVLPDVLSHFRCPTPLLEKLDIHIPFLAEPDSSRISGALFNGELPSLRELYLCGVITDLAWRNTWNLTVFTLSNPQDFKGFKLSVTQILDFFESAPFLQRVEFYYPFPNSSDAPPGRIVPLRRLKTLALGTHSPPSVLFNHLHIPTGAALMLCNRTKSEEFSPLDYLPDKFPNFENLSHITMVNLCLARDTKSVRLGGPSGSLRLVSDLSDARALPSATVDHRVLRSIGPPRLPTIQRLAVAEYTHTPQAGVEECPVFRTLCSLETLRTLVLFYSDTLPFILALNPEKNSSEIVPCPNLEELIIYPLSHPRHGDLVEMSRSRDSKGAKLSSIVIIDTQECSMEEEVSKLKENVTHVEYRRESYSFTRPGWDGVLDEW